MIDNIEFRNISFSYPLEKTVIENLNFSLPLNQWVLIKGGLGSGKSTFMKLLLGLLKPDNGEIYFNQESIHDLGFEEFSKYLGHIGHVLEEDGLLANQSLLENLSLPLIYHKNMSLEERSEWINIWLKELNLWSYKDFRPAFATGEVRRIFTILRALIIKPEMIILHNPLKYLSETNTKKIMSLIQVFEEKYNLKHVVILSDDDRMVIENKKVTVFNLIEGKIQ